MALRAGYFGLKRFEKNKLSVLAASMPADISPDNPIAGKNDVLATVDLMKDTTGWIGGNECVNNAVSKTENGVTWAVNADKSISAYGQPTEGDAYIDVNSEANVSANGVAWICNGCPSGGANDKYYSQLRLSNPNGTWYGARIDTGNGYQLTEAEVTANVKIQYRCVIPSGAPAIPQSSPIVFRPMIISPEQYALNPSYRPYHESVEEMLKPKLLTSANDLDDVKKGGDYYWTQSYPAHSPENNTFGALRVLPCGEVIHQMVIRAAANSASIYIRRFQETWSNWFKFTGTEITPPTREEETKKATKKKVIKEEED